MQALRNILVGTDFSPCADAALDVAIAFGAERITLVHVCELAELGLSDARDDELLERCRAQLDAVVARYTSRGLAITGLLRTGKAWEKLHNAAAEVGATLIVIGRVGSGGGVLSDGPSLGVVAKQVLRRSSRPVLMVPPLDLGVARAEAV